MISGEYFGWSYGWAKAGTLGFLVTSAFVAAMYTTFIFSFTELTTSIPHAGGPSPTPSGRSAQWADTSPAWRHWSSSCSRHPPFRWPSARISISSFGLSPTTAAVGAYLIFMSLNIVGVQIAAAFELTITLLAVFELLVFMGVVAPGFHWSNFTQGGWAGADSFRWARLAASLARCRSPSGSSSRSRASPWRRSQNPRRSIPIAYITGILTLVVLAMGVMLFAGGVGDWKLLADINDPLPQAMKLIVGKTTAGCTC